MAEWKIDRAAAEKKWPKFSEDDLDRGLASRGELIDYLRNRYNLSPEEAAKEIEAFLANDRPAKKK